MEAHDSNTLVGSVRDDRYRIEALLGQGAVGAVYRAVDVTTGERVALKQWHATSLNDEVRKRFLREATALATLDHPNIVNVVGHGFVDGVPYVALEYLEGQTLETMLADGKPLELELCLELARQALSAIAYAHSHEVVHRDLKPENIFVAHGPNGQPLVKILDYGLAKFMSQQSVLGGTSTPLTALGAMLGTPLYMPPEQAAGGSVDLAVDVYSFGCVLFEMLSGQPPFMAPTNLDLINAHLRAPVPVLAAALPGMRVAPELQALIDRAMAKKQTERFANAGAMLEALQKIPAGPITKAEAVEEAEAVHAAPEPAAPVSPAHADLASDGRAKKPSSALIWIAVASLAAVAVVLARAC